MPDLDHARGSTVLATLRRAVARSRVFARLRTAWDEGRETGPTVARTAKEWWRSSLVSRTASRPTVGLDHSVEDSHVAVAASTLDRWLRGSALYHWLTTEPEPEVVVIDLRETTIIGPTIAVLDWLWDVLAGGRPTSATVRIHTTALERVLDAPIRAASAVLLATVVAGFVAGITLGTLGWMGLAVAVVGTVLGILGLRNDTSWTQLRETRTARLLSAAFAPPEPSDQVEGADDTTAAREQPNTSREE